MSDIESNALSASLKICGMPSEMLIDARAAGFTRGNCHV